MVKKTGNRPFDTGMLAFERSIQISEALMGATTMEMFDADQADPKVVPIEVQEKGVRGQTANDVNQAKLLKEMKDQSGNSNIQTVHNAVIPQGFDALVVDFDLRILPQSRKPHSCDNPDVAGRYQQIANIYSDVGGYETLAERYIWNIANGRFAWRNRFMTDLAEVRLSWNGREIRFDPLHLNLEKFDNRETMSAAMTKGTREDLDDAISAFATGLSKQPQPMSVRWISRMGSGQEVFPSQEYLREEIAKEIGLSRVYAILPVRRDGEPDIQQASIHSQKIGAAIRHIDDWHGSDMHGVIAVNPYGGVQSTSEILRDTKRKSSLYDLRRDVDLMDQILATKDIADLPVQTHFIMSNLIRGGVFGEAK